MLIEFSVANFRSIRERQTLSLVASNRVKGLPDNLLKPDLPGLSNTKLLKSAAIYGPNASGKSSLFQAGRFMQSFVCGSAVDRKPGEQTGVVPFRLDAHSASEPTEFEVLFVHEGSRYQYGFTLNKERVLEEWLMAYPRGRAQNWFHRSFDEASSEYDWDFSSTHFKGDKHRLSGQTRPNALFLSTGAQWDHPQLGSLYEWFRFHFRFLDLSQVNPPSGPAISLSLLEGREELRDAVRSLIRHADPSIVDYEIERTNWEDGDLANNLLPAVRKELLKQVEGAPLFKLHVLHQGLEMSEAVRFGAEEESTGTLKYFSLLGPWIDVLGHGYTVFVDEIGASMHPLLVRSLVEALHLEKVNQQGAQLVFTTHDTTLLDKELLRRDQVWFMEKDQHNTTKLYPLLDFKPRNDEALQKGYLAGRYGALPFLEAETES